VRGECVAHQTRCDGWTPGSCTNEASKWPRTRCTALAEMGNNYPGDAAQTAPLGDTIRSREKSNPELKSDSPNETTKCCDSVALHAPKQPQPVMS